MNPICLLFLFITQISSQYLCANTNGDEVNAIIVSSDSACSGYSFVRLHQTDYNGNAPKINQEFIGKKLTLSIKENIKSSTQFGDYGGTSCSLKELIIVLEANLSNYAYFTFVNLEHDFPFTFKSELSETYTQNVFIQYQYGEKPTRIH